MSQETPLQRPPVPATAPRSTAARDALDVGSITGMSSFDPLGHVLAYALAVDLLGALYPPSVAFDRYRLAFEDVTSSYDSSARDAPDLPSHS